MPGRAKKRLAAKKAKESMANRSGDKSSGGMTGTDVGSEQEAPEKNTEEHKRGVTGARESGQIADAG